MVGLGLELRWVCLLVFVVVSLLTGVLVSLGIVLVVGAVFGVGSGGVVWFGPCAECADGW